MQISNRLAGYSLGEADLLRRAMGKKKVEEMAKQRERFLAGAKAKGHPLRKVEKIFDQMAKFAGYGFNKSHSAAYAYLAFIVGVSESALSAGVHERAAHFGNRQHRQGGQVHQRVPRDGHQGPSAGRQHLRIHLYAGHNWRCARHSLRSGRDQECGSIGCGIHRQSARATGGASARSTIFASAWI